MAQLAGISNASLSRIENGRQSLDSQRLADKIADALGVQVGALTEGRSIGSDVVLAADLLRLALAVARPADEPRGTPPPWEAVIADIAAIDTLRQRSDYVGVSLMLPAALARLHRHTRGPRRRDALIGLVKCFRAAQAAAHGIGARDLTVLAGHQVEAVASQIDGPEWAGLALWTRVVGLAGISRAQSHLAAVTALNQLDPYLADLRVAEVAGTLHLAAAHTSATIGRRDDAAAHLKHAAQLAEHIGDGQLTDLTYFGRWNVGAWETTIAVELGDGGRVMEIAQTLEGAPAPAPTRRAAWLIDYGRGASMAHKTLKVAKRALLEAEHIAPQRLRADPGAQETVTVLRNRARIRDHELEDLAERMGIVS